MTEFVLALMVFLLAHSLPNALGWRDQLIKRFGRKAYILSYSLLSTALLIWLIMAALRAPYIEVWQPSAITALFPLVFMLVASVLLASAILRPNRLSIAFVSRPVVSGDGILVLLRHPLLWALFLWASGHAVANGDVVSLILFGGLAIFTLAGMKIMERRARRTLSATEFSDGMALARGPLGARLASMSTAGFLLEVIVGVLLYGLLLFAHEPVIGVDPLALALP